MAGYAAPRRRWNHPPVAGLLRRHEGVRPQGIEAVNCLRRVVACVGGYFLGDFAGVTHGLLNHAHGHTLPSHISKMVLSTVRAGPPGCFPGVVAHS